MSEQQNNLLIAEYNATRGEEAFAGLVRQHINLVFATAMRQVGDRGAAEEITQNVFVTLAQASDKLKSHPTIAGWLYRTTLNKSREWLRSDLRRRRREQIAVSQELARSEGDSVWSPLVPLLDEALLGLHEPDRLAIIMHFMEGQTFQEVGSALGIGEDTARKRVNRCFDQLTHFFRRRGFEVPALTAGAPLFALSSHAAPAGLTASAAAAGLAAHSTTSTSTLTLIKGALKIMAWTKAKTAIVVSVGVLLAAGTTFVILKDTPAARLAANRARARTGVPTDPQAVAHAAETAKVLIFRDIPSWNRHPDFEEALTSLNFKFDVKPSAEMATTDLSAYDVVIIPGGQWNTPIHANYASHGYLEGAPKNAMVIATEALKKERPDLSRPTFIEYACGSGRVLAACQCFHDRDGSHRGPWMPAVIDYAAVKKWFSPR